MSGRERTFFSFDVDEWINALLERFKSQVQNHAAKLASQIEHFTTAKLATELELLDPKQKADFVKNLRSDIDAITLAFTQFMQEALNTNGEILATYLRDQVFQVPASAILAINPIDVPIPVQNTEESMNRSEMEKSTQKTPKKRGKSQDTQNEQMESLKSLLTKIHKQEYLLSRLKQLHDENEQYLQLLQNILHSLLQLDEITKANDTEMAVHQIFDTLQSSLSIMHSIQDELAKRGITTDLQVPAVAGN